MWPPPPPPPSSPRGTRLLAAATRNRVRLPLLKKAKRWIEIEQSPEEEEEELNRNRLSYFFCRYFFFSVVPFFDTFRCGGKKRFEFLCAQVTLRDESPVWVRDTARALSLSSSSSVLSRLLLPRSLMRVIKQCQERRRRHRQV